MATLSVFEAGYCTHTACVALRGAGLRTCAFPARAWLIEAAGRRWLWDTGYASHFHDHTRSGLFAIYRKVTPCISTRRNPWQHSSHNRACARLTWMD